MVDVMADLLDLVRIERVQFLVIEIAAPGGISVPIDGNMWFYLMLDGEAVLNRADGDPTVHLERGDMALLINGETFALRDAQASPVTALTELPEPRHKPDLPWIRSGGNGPKSLLVCAAFRVDRERAKPLLRRLPDLLQIKSETHSLPDWGGPLCDLTTLRLITSGPGSVAIMRRFAEAFVVQVIRLCMIRGKLPAEHTSIGLCRPQISASLRLINSRPEHAWTVSALARQTGMSRSAFAAAFAQEVGESPVHYLTGVRMSMASELLRLETISVSQVAFRVGFASETSFARTFKRHFGMAPSEFRRPNDPPVKTETHQTTRAMYPGFVFFG